eukprot:CAMPEP_0114348394 /NCGR_PEP_ID=MMETSP0101-20121206/14662_1 /TAXON_ID=38822 ORGANISM="Pteridomonas danica, Strain PT" /NCGR_SAMPLE_ID=MMETSP0101 /ASSEMBLY_ACC=CAM_ASM_000211 /LENGTH=130 /DNA_ID=CAMNT_0001486271 /DNA_START=88 /DNA_END=481 /DNA_ORIENTATION=-
MAQLEEEIRQNEVLFLGTEVYAESKSGLKDIGVTHRLSCLMSKEEENQWITYATFDHTKADESEVPILPNLQFIIAPPNEQGIIVARSPMADEDLFGPFAKEFLDKGASFINEVIQSSDKIVSMYIVHMV